MEESRLKPMVANYDQQLFNRIYSETMGLKKSLARNIDCRRFGVCYEDIVSWFDVKLIYVFNKYYGETEGVLKAKIINALQNFRQRVLRSAYTFDHTQNIVAVETLLTFDDTLTDTQEDESKDYYYNTLMKFMRDHLTENAYTLLQVQLNPPPYILKRINPSPQDNLQKIPDEVLLDYFDLGFSDKAYRFISKLKKEIRETTHYAKTKFRAS